jgi:hypothetical protein
MGHIGTPGVGKRRLVLCWLPRSSWSVGVPVSRLLRHNSLPTVWASIVFFQPCAYAIAVKPVTTWQHGDLVANLHAIHANRAFRFPITAHHAFIDFLFRKSLDGLGRSRPRGGRPVGLFHELRNHPVQSFFGVYGVTVGRIGRVEKLRED